MQVTAYKTVVIQPGDNLEKVIAESISSLPERAVVAVVSKVVSTAENRIVPKKTGSREEKYALARQEADWYLDPHSSKYGLMLTIKDNWMFMFAGIDESNIKDGYLLWPTNPQEAANKLWNFFRNHYGLKEIGVIITDSTSSPLNWGVRGHAIAYCGFNPLFSYVGEPDLFGRPFQFEQLNIMQSVAAFAALAMGEGNESTPFSVITDIPKIEFLDHVPTPTELAALHIDLDDDAYQPLLAAANWQSDATVPQASINSFKRNNEVTEMRENSELLYKAAVESGLNPSWETEYGVFSFEQDGEKYFQFHTFHPVNDVMHSYWAKNKQLTRIVLAKSGYSNLNIPWCLPQDLSELETFFDDNGPVIAKPLMGSKSRSVFLLKKRFELKMFPFKEYYFEQFTQGIEKRYLILDGEVIGVQEKISVSKSNWRKHRRTLTQIEWNEDQTKLALQLSKVFNLTYGAVDFLIEEDQIKVLEVNGSPGMKTFHYPDQGEPIDVATQLMNSILKTVKKKK